MTLSAVATRYANAFADVVTDAGSALKPEAAAAELHSFEEVLKSSTELHNALLSPSVPGPRKRAVVTRIAEILKLSHITRNFLCVLMDHRRIGLLSDVIRDFELIADARMGFAHAAVITARELNEPQRFALSDQLERLTGKRLRMNYTVDAALIGGAIARIGSTVYDGSVRGQLAIMSRRLSAQV